MKILTVKKIMVMEKHAFNIPSPGSISLCRIINNSCLHILNADIKTYIPTNVQKIFKLLVLNYLHSIQGPVVQS